MENVYDYLFVTICLYAIVVNLLRIIKALFNPGFLKSGYFNYPTTRFHCILYYLSAILCLLVGIWLKLNWL